MLQALIFLWLLPLSCSERQNISLPLRCRNMAPLPPPSLKPCRLEYAIRLVSGQTKMKRVQRDL
ncbi:hypothetical protein AOLI_G00130960 [Acnodon oligacanthus]